MFYAYINVNLMVENVVQIKSGITINAGASVKIWKKHHPCVKYYIWNPAICSCKTGKYLASIIDNSIITCGEIIYTTKNVPTKSVLEKSISVNLYILLSVLLVTIAIISIIYSVALQLNEVLY